MEKGIVENVRLSCYVRNADIFVGRSEYVVDGYYSCTSPIAVLAAVIIVLSNLASNVPTVLLLGGRVAASAAAMSPGNEKKPWLVLGLVMHYVCLLFCKV